MNVITDRIGSLAFELRVPIDASASDAEVRALVAWVSASMIAAHDLGLIVEVRLVDRHTGRLVEPPDSPWL